MSSISIFILIIHLILYISIGLDIPILRQCFGFIYLTFIPGFIIIFLLKIKDENILNTYVLSVSLSIAFLMFTGFIMNTLYPILGILRPLSITPLLITITFLTLLFFVVSHRKEITNDINEYKYIIEGLRIKDIFFLIILIFFPLLNAVGALYVKTFLLLLMIIGITTLYAISIFTEKLIPIKLYPFLILSISISLLFQTSLISKHIMGWDIFTEYHVFMLTKIAGYWNAPGVAFSISTTDVMNSILSVTILPTIYSVFLNLDGELIFKVIYPFIFSLVPLLLYRIYELQLRKIVALLSTFYFMSNLMIFYSPEMLSLARQMIGQLFFVSSIFYLINRNITLQNKRILLMIFSIAIVISHYSLSFIYLFYIFFTFVISQIRGIKTSLNRELVLFIIVITFSWYIYISNPPLQRLIWVFQHMIERFKLDLFEPQARLSEGVARLSPFIQTNIIGWTHKILFYLTHLFIIIGIIILTIKPKDFKIYPEFRLMMLLSVFILSICLVIPNFASTLGFSRFYQIIMFFFTPLFSLGGMHFLKYFGKFFNIRLSKDLNFRILTIILIAFFLFQVGFVNHVTKYYPYSYSLDINRKKSSTNFNITIDFYKIYVTEQEVYSAKWISKNMNDTLMVFADANSYYHILYAFALLPLTQINALYKNATFPESSYIYLNYLNVQKGVIIPLGVTGYYGTPFNTTDIQFFKNNKIYSNSYSNIYYSH